MKINTKVDRIGETNINNFGSKMTIIDYKDNKNITVKFDNGYIMNTRYTSFESGGVKSPYCKSVFSIGYIGEGIYKASENRKATIEYSFWKCMLTRCYDKKFKERQSPYKDVVCCTEWHNFQNFAEWFNNNYYEVKNQRMQLDKDILVKGNKIYSPNTCVFVPNNINMLFVRRYIKKELPIGVIFKDNKYESYMSKIVYSRKSSVYLGAYNTPKEAFDIYKIEKEKYIKEIANKYKDIIPKNLYNAMINYIVEITD